MRKMIVLITVVCFLFLPALVFAQKGFDVYTFKKERVDQKITGNQGYIMGKPPQAPERENLERTLIGVDVLLPPLLPEKESGDEDYDEEAGEVQPEKAVIVEEKVEKGGAEKVEVEEEEEEEWIK